MSRYVNEVSTTFAPEQVAQVTADYLQSEGFALKDYQGEPVWQKGGGWAAVPQFVKVEGRQGIAHIEAWLAGVAILPGVYPGEQALTGKYAFAMKKVLRDRVAELERRLSLVQVAAAEQPTVG
jgi:hypothetical protein